MHSQSLSVLLTKGEEGSPSAALLTVLMVILYSVSSSRPGRIKLESGKETVTSPPIMPGQPVPKFVYRGNTWFCGPAGQADVKCYLC